MLPKSMLQELTDHPHGDEQEKSEVHGALEKRATSGHRLPNILKSQG